MNLNAVDRAAILTALRAAEYAAEGAMVLLSDALRMADSDADAAEILTLHGKASDAQIALLQARAALNDFGSPRPT